MKFFDIVRQLASLNGNTYSTSVNRRRNPRGRRKEGVSDQMASIAQERPRNGIARQHNSIATEFVDAAGKPAALSLQQAAQILINTRQAGDKHADLALQRDAFAQLHDHLRQHDFTHRTDNFQPLLTLIAGRISHLACPHQREQAVSLIEDALAASPQLALAEALTPQIWTLEAPLQMRALSAIQAFLHETGDLPQLHVDILVELTDLMQIPQCRERAYAMVQTGLTQLRHEPELAGRIRRGLMLTYCMDTHGMSLQP